MGRVKSILDLPEDKRVIMESRFWSNVDKTEQCWLWRGRTNHGIYGAFSLAHQSPTHAHQVAHELIKGRVPKGNFIHWRCGNKLCVNPDHFEVATPKEFGRRRTARKTHCPKGHPLTQDNLIKAAWRKGRKQCRTCNSENGKIRDAIDPDKKRLTGLLLRRRLKEELLSHYTPNGKLECACCGTWGLAFLTLDHVNNDGAAHKRQLEPNRPDVQKHSNLNEWLRKNNYPNDPPLQILCWNCNCAKLSNGVICPHQRELSPKEIQAINGRRRQGKPLNSPNP